MPDVRFSYVAMANAQPLAMYEVAAAGQITAMDNIIAAGDVTTERLSEFPLIEELTSSTVEAGQFVVTIDYPTVARRTRILLEDGAARMAFFANELQALFASVPDIVSEPITREQFYYAHLLGGWVSQPIVKGGVDSLQRGGDTFKEALRAGVSSKMAVAALDAAEEL